jgi:hypothetical protein
MMSPVRAILWIIFVSVPSIILAGYAVYKVNEVLLTKYGISINENVYWLTLLFAMWAALWLSSRRILKAIFSSDLDK